MPRVVPMRHSLLFLLLKSNAANSDSRIGMTTTEVTFYDNIWHDGSGGSHSETLAYAQACYNLDCFNDRASSAKWTDFDKVGVYEGKTRIAFYTEVDCNGRVRDWAIDAPNGFPGNFFLDGIDNQISSFMIWQKNKKKELTASCNERIKTSKYTGRR